MKRDERTGLFLPERVSQRNDKRRVLMSFIRSQEDIDKFDRIDQWLPSIGGAGIGYVDTKITSQLDGANLTAAPRDKPPAGSSEVDGSRELLANSGQIMKITVAGRLGNIVTTPGTLTIDVRMGPTATSSSGTAARCSSRARSTRRFRSGSRFC